MLRPEVIEQLFDLVDETSMIISSELKMSYLHAMCESCENIMSQEISQSISEESKETLQQQYAVLEGLEFTQEEIRKALQLAILKGLKSERLTNAIMTPDSIALILGYLISKFVKNFNEVRMADLTVGTGNLLTATLNHLQVEPQEIFGVEIDRDLLKIACTLSDMQEYAVQFYQQSSLKPLFIDPLDLIIGDLPEGQLEEEEMNQLGLTLAQKGVNYLPYLLIENHLNYLKPGGYAFYVIPNDLFSQTHSQAFHQLLTSKANIQALLQLPTTLFKQDELGKSLFIIQKNGEHVKPVGEVLVAQLPNFNDAHQFNKMLTRIENWIKLNK
ncbi:class I SAM-dependent methyltransferase [Turicibacter sp. TJ11]|uniref:class I SAM-dependent methyltransferase n=1 Tax=Turicibacter sp. TJ11 TaxID=2806443 RepID=UPI001F2B71A9|nr:class I SAM-dependent methyltransferase [Turicibacter sp. TJ11]